VAAQESGDEEAWRKRRERKVCWRFPFPSLSLWFVCADVFMQNPVAKAREAEESPEEYVHPTQKGRN
jgi:hypothetical protein